MYSILISVIAAMVLLSATATGQLSPAELSPTSPEVICADSRISQVLADCQTNGHSEGTVTLKQCVCAGLGIETNRCDFNCLSPSVRESSSMYSTGMTTAAGDRNFDGELKIPAMVTVPLTANHKHPAVHAGVLGGKGDVDIPGSIQQQRKLRDQQKQRHRRRRKNAGAVTKQNQSNGMSNTARKILGGIAVGILVMAI